MKIGQVVLPFYSATFSIVVTLGALAYSLSSGNFFFFLFFLPIFGYFILSIFHIKSGYKLLLYYSFIFVTVMVLMGFVNASTVPQLISALLFCPLAFYFWSRVFPKTLPSLTIPQQGTMSSLKAEPIQEDTVEEEETEPNKEETSRNNKINKDFDENRRMFIKLIGSAGLGVLVYSLFSKKASLPFFGQTSTNSDTIVLKDSLGNPIDPAVKQPTDAYKIAEVDDSSPTFFGFVEKPNKWFIMQIEDSGAVRYAKGEGDFSGNWKNRANLKYGYYDEVF